MTFALFTWLGIYMSAPEEGKYQLDMPISITIAPKSQTVATVFPGGILVSSFGSSPKSVYLAGDFNSSNAKTAVSDDGVLAYVRRGSSDVEIYDIKHDNSIGYLRGPVVIKARRVQCGVHDFDFLPGNE